MPHFVSQAQIGQRDAEASADILLHHLDLPVLPHTHSRRFWPFTYEAHCVTAIVNKLPPCLSAIIVSAIRHRSSQPHGSLPRIHQLPSSPSSLAAENSIPAGLTEELHFGVVKLSVPTQSTAENRAETPTARLTVGSIEGGASDAGGSIVPLVELDMLCLLLHGLMHAGRRRMRRYLRLWLGCGAAALILWETEQAGRGQVRRATRTRECKCVVRNIKFPLAFFALPCESRRPFAAPTAAM